MKVREHAIIGVGYRITIFAGLAMACVALAGGVMIQAHEDEALLSSLALPQSERRGLAIIPSNRLPIRIWADGRIHEPLESTIDQVHEVFIAADKEAPVGVVCQVVRNKNARGCRFVVKRSIGTISFTRTMVVPILRSEVQRVDPREMRDLEIGTDWLRYDGRQISIEALGEIAAEIAQQDRYAVVVVPFEAANMGRLVDVLDILHNGGITDPYLLP